MCVWRPFSAVLQFGIVDADGALSLWQTNTSGNTPKPYLVSVLTSLQTLSVSSRLPSVVSVFVCFSITVTVAKSLPALTPADVAVPQQDGSWLRLRGLLLAHCHRGSIDRQPVSAEELKEKQDLFYFSHILRLESERRVPPLHVWGKALWDLKKLRVHWVV